MKNMLSGIKKILFAFFCTGSIVLGACSTPVSKPVDVVETETAVSHEEEIEETGSEPEEVITEVEGEEEKISGDHGETEYEEIKLDGVKDHHFIADDFCFIESEKYVLFLEKGIEIPGDFVINTDAIVDELEKQLNVSYAPSGYIYSDVCSMVAYYGFNPWEGWNIGTKIPIFLVVDDNNETLISCACGEFMALVDYGMFSENFWNSTPGFFDSDFRVRPDYVDYSTIAHEMTHVITERNHEMPRTMTEGIADYMARKVMDSLAGDYPSIAEAKENVYLYDNPIPEKVNSKNAERVFIEDYNQVEHAKRGAEYTFGRYLCQFLNETYGDDFYSKYNSAIIEKKIDYSYGNYDEEILTEFADTLKESFGEDVFTEFGSWCVKKHALQELNGVWP